MHCLDRRRRLIVIAPLVIALVACGTTRSDGWAAFEKGDHAHALAVWTPLADLGDPVAEYLVGMLHDDGLGVPEDDALAARWYERAAEQDHAAALLNLGLLYYRGSGVARSYERAAECFRRAAAQDFGKAETNLAVLHIFGRGAPRDLARARDLLHRASRHGDAQADRILASLDVDAGQTRPGDDIFVEAIRKAADRGVPEAKLAIGRIDDPRTLDLLQLFAQQGHATAQFNLGLFHLRGTSGPIDRAAALHWIRHAAEQDLPIAQARLGAMYETGTAVDADLVAAHMWSRLAADQGDRDAAAAVARIECRLGADQVAQSASLARAWKSRRGCDARVGDSPSSPSR